MPTGILLGLSSFSKRIKDSNGHVLIVPVHVLPSIVCVAVCEDGEVRVDVDGRGCVFVCHLSMSLECRWACILLDDGCGPFYI